MDDLLADFIAETRDMLEASAGEIVAWETDPADRARLDAIFRFVHTVKGNCGFFDFPRLERLSHAAEDTLADCRNGRREPDSALVSAVLAIIDRIGEMVDTIEAGEDLSAGNDDALIAALSHEPVVGIEPVSVATPKDTAQSGGDKPNRAATQRSIRLPVGLLDEVMKGVSDMVLARNDLSRRLREESDDPALLGSFERLSTILADVRNSISRMRMQRLEHLFSSLPRLVRDLSSELGKQVMVDCEGGDVELDREMVEIIRDPLTHIIRNAIDHGIEPPSERLKSGKREIGLLRFAARQSGNQIALVISDDGHGIDIERISAKALASGLRSAAELAQMSEREKQLLIFEPGLSTADKVSKVSGRGVGMDVVRANIEKVGGKIDISSTPGEGTVIYLQLPLTLSIISALTVETNGLRYAIPRSYVEEVMFASLDGVEYANAGERRLVTFRDQRVPCIELGAVLGAHDTDESDWDDKTLVLIRLASDEIFALAVDRVHDHEDVVVKPLAPALMQTRLYAGTTLLDDGRPMMLLDMPSIAASRGFSTEIRSRAAPDESEASREPAKGVPVMLFTGLDGRRRAARLALVRRIDTVARDALDIEGSRAQVVINGRILPLAGHTCGPLPEQRCRLLRLSDGQGEMAYLVREVIDASWVTDEIAPGDGDPTIEGVALIDNRPVTVIDTHHLFTERLGSVAAIETLTCHLPGDDEWSRTILEPLLIEAGYRIEHNHETEADLAIVLSEDTANTGQSARTTIRVSSEPDDKDEGQSIYRYDREALLAALARARTERAA
ncbi:MAG: chemotaxis protein CheA [Sphingomonadaceae bacterium]